MQPVESEPRPLAGPIAAMLRIEMCDVTTVTGSEKSQLQVQVELLEAARRSFDSESNHATVVTQQVSLLTRTVSLCHSGFR